MKVISICDHKGGVGKTTSAAAIAQGITKLHPRSKVLLIDADPQGTATKTIHGIREAVPGLYEVLKGDISILDAIRRTEAGEVLPYSRALASLDVEFSGDLDAYFLLRERLSELDGIYSHVIIDTAPGLSLATVQALTASDSVIIPIGAYPETVDSLPQTMKTIQSVRRVNSDLVILGALITMYAPRSNVIKQFEELIEDTCKKSKIYLIKTRVRNCAAIHEAHALNVSLFDYAPRSNAVKDYTAVIKELKL